MRGKQYTTTTAKTKIPKKKFLKLTDKICFWPHWHHRLAPDPLRQVCGGSCTGCFCARQQPSRLFVGFGHLKCNKIRKWNKFDLISLPQINVLPFREHHRFTNTVSMRCMSTPHRADVSGRLRLRLRVGRSALSLCVCVCVWLFAMMTRLWRKGDPKARGVCYAGSIFNICAHK